MGRTSLNKEKGKTDFRRENVKSDERHRGAVWGVNL